MAVSGTFNAVDDGHEFTVSTQMNVKVSPAGSTVKLQCFMAGHSDWIDVEGATFTEDAAGIVRSSGYDQKFRLVCTEYVGAARWEIGA